MAMHHSDGYVPFWVEVNERRFDKAERDPGRNFKSTLHPIRVYPRLAQGDDTLAVVDVLISVPYHHLLHETLDMKTFCNLGVNI